MSLIKKYKLYIFLALFIGVSVYLANIYNNKELAFKCPGDYRTTEEYVDDLARFISILQKENPNIIEDEIFSKRQEWLDANGCKPE